MGAPLPHWVLLDPLHGCVEAHAGLHEARQEAEHRGHVSLDLIHAALPLLPDPHHREHHHEEGDQPGRRPHDGDEDGGEPAGHALQPLDRRAGEARGVQHQGQEG